MFWSVWSGRLGLRDDAILLSFSDSRPGNEACPTRPHTCSIYILYPSWSHTSQRNVNSTFELHNGLKPIYSIIIVVIWRPLVFLCDSVTFLIWSWSQGGRMRRRPSPTLPHPARVSVYLVPYIACRDTVENEAGRRMRRRPFPTLAIPAEVW